MVRLRKAPDRKIQDAHEAIRPTDIRRLPVKVKESLSRDQFRLYQLIWKRFAASCMADAKYHTTSVKIDGAGYRFTVSASVVAFDGFMSVYVQDEEKSDNSSLLKDWDQIQSFSFWNLRTNSISHSRHCPLYRGCIG